jgi:uncharacterized membrane protein YjgN (DUF898 family)
MDSQLYKPDSSAMSGMRWSKPEFNGTIKEFLPLWLKTLGLTLVTLGIYRFWATAEIRRYLWSSTEILDEPLEFTGTGKELFIGFLLALLLFILPVSLLNFGLPFLFKSFPAQVGGILTLFYLYIFVITNFAMYRAQRYRLTRTLWRGIRGGMAQSGWTYGFVGLGMYMLGAMTLGFMMPYASTFLWNMRWNDASFGSQMFSSDAPWRPMFTRYWQSILAFVGISITASVIFFTQIADRFSGFEETITGGIALAVAMVIGFYALAGLVFIAYRALQLRIWIGHLSWGPIKFHFTARTTDWLFFYLKVVGLLILTFGTAIFGLISFFSWRFMCRHLDIEGDINAAFLNQSTTEAPGHGEGLADALDVGAF